MSSLNTELDTNEGIDSEIKAKVRSQLKQKPVFDSPEDALSSLNKKLEQIAVKYSLSISKLFVKAESSMDHNQDFLVVLSLKNQISGLKKLLKK